MKISDPPQANNLEDLPMPPELVMQLVQVSSAFLVTLNSYIASTREIDRRARRLRRSRMLLLLRLLQLREDKHQRSLLPSPRRGGLPLWRLPPISRLAEFFSHSIVSFFNDCLLIQILGGRCTPVHRSPVPERVPCQQENIQLFV